MHSLQWIIDGTPKVIFNHYKSDFHCMLEPAQARENKAQARPAKLLFTRARARACKFQPAPVPARKISLKAGPARSMGCGPARPGPWAAGRPGPARAIPRITAATTLDRIVVFRIMQIWHRKCSDYHKVHGICTIVRP